MKKFFLAAGSALLFAWGGLYAQTGTYGGVNLLGSEISVDGEVEIMNVCVPPPNTKTGTCILINEPLDPNWPISSLPNAVASRYCVLRRVLEDDPCCKTSANLVVGMEVGGDSDVMELQWQFTAENRSACEVGCPYFSFADGSGTLSVELSVSGAQGTIIPVWYDFSGYLAAYSKPENILEDSAKVEVISVSIGGNDLHEAGSMPTFMESEDFGFGGDYRQLSLSGYLWAPANTTFEIVVEARVRAFVDVPGEQKPDQICGMEWVERGDAVYFGNLRLSANEPLEATSPPSDASPAQSYFSLDIGSASELSDPFADGSEFFDPGDAYRVRGPALPPGGADGTLDDAVFMGTDIPPSAPDPAIPSLTAAPVGSGLPPGSVIPQYLNIDALARTDFDFAAPPPGGIPISYNQFLSQCVFAPRYLYLSFDDDRPGHYTDLVPSVPANSTWSFDNSVFGSDFEKDEIMELYALHPFFGGTTVAVGVASESMVNNNLAPNPSPFGPDQENDDVNALSLGYSAGCDNWYISVDHEATGTLPDGTQPDPGTIYKVNPGPVGLSPVAGPAALGIPAGTDVDAFEFVSIFQPFSLPQGPGLAVLFSVDVDDPLTPTVDESGGLDPGIIYASFMNGSYFVYDSAGFSENIDAISNLPNSISNPAQVNTCNSYNFTAPPTGLTLDITGNTLTVEWDPYPFATKCQVAGNRIDQSGDQTFIVDNVSPPSKNGFTFSGSQIQSNETYRVRVRCGCSTSNVSPFTSYEFVTAPTPGPPSNGQPYLFAEENSEEPAMTLFPNPADAFVTLQSNEAADGRVTVRVFNALGQAVLAETFDASELTAGRRIETSGLTRGMYSVQAEMPGRIETLQLMITR